MNVLIKKRQDRIVQLQAKRPERPEVGTQTSGRSSFFGSLSNSVVLYKS